MLLHHCIASLMAFLKYTNASEKSQNKLSRYIYKTWLQSFSTPKSYFHHFVFPRSAAAFVLLAPKRPPTPPNNAVFKLPTTPSSFLGSSGSSGSGNRRWIERRRGKHCEERQGTTTSSKGLAQECNCEDAFWKKGGLHAFKHTTEMSLPHKKRT